eukprot:CAMPEP_0115270524 /NCGR_PEP_ID=MMETSP0270-20121206/53615_1 /TAXON_ID=71861 /ORGANISM="Scrippsiella trochoidea, Strain CCMP3099" /LENGTH=106 /DNA_ID=CAMNT_0002686829 /DNA_START=96 /DNA_END=413 /DNA_ORIENTATION=+
MGCRRSSSIWAFALALALMIGAGTSPVHALSLRGPAGNSTEVNAALLAGQEDASQSVRFALKTRSVAPAIASPTSGASSTFELGSAKASSRAWCLLRPPLEFEGPG